MSNGSIPKTYSNKEIPVTRTGISLLALAVGIEPTTDRLTADCSTAELRQKRGTMNKYSNQK